ncbi:MAG: hypothetical protein ACI97A_001186 [Planctomycetota bacterium]|jgi:hypothetical protein
MRHMILVLSVLVVVASPASSQKQARVLDKSAQKELAGLALRFWKARPIHYFKSWDDQEKAAIFKAAQEWGPTPEGSLEALTKIFWKPTKKYGARFDKKSGNRGILKTPYGDAWFFIKGSSKKALVVGLHGGGEGAGSASEPAGTWSMKGAMGMYPQGIRLVHDTWNTVHGERFILSMIEIAKCKYQIDPDRVYTMGFSMGGTGSWFMAGRHPDLLAGSMPCAGVLMARPKSQLPRKEQIKDVQHGMVPNVRNLAMWYFIGLSDKNCMPGTYLFVADMLQELREEDKGGYGKINFKTYPGLAHAMAPGEPSNGIRYLANERRNKFPKKVVWEVATRPHPRRATGDLVARYNKQAFYWLRCPDAVDRQIIRATRAGNRIDLEVEGTRNDAEGITIMLNPSMIDVKKDIEVYLEGTRIYQGKPKPNLGTFLTSLNDRADRAMVFDRQIDL